MKEFWNERFAEKDFAYGTEANEFFEKPSIWFRLNYFMLGRRRSAP